MTEKKITLRERCISTALFHPADRAFRWETLGFWKETLDRWHNEGLPREVDDGVKAYVYNNFDLQAAVLFDHSNNAGVYPLFNEVILREEGESLIKKDIYGNIVQVPKDSHSTIPHFLQSPVKDRTSWEEYKTRLDPLTPGRLDSLELPFILAEQQAWPMWVYIPGLFGTHRHLFGVEPLMYAYFDTPDLIHDIARHWVYQWKTILGTIARRHVPAVVYIWEDMCGKNGPIISPAMFDEFMTPYYLEFVAFLKNELGIPVVAVDTDGDINLLIPKFVNAGVNMLLPFEVQAGMDVVKVREEWPDQFAIMGGIDKRELAKGKDAIVREVNRVLPFMLKKGGYFPAIDHEVPPDVSWDNWVFFRDLVREIVDRYYGV